MEKPVSRNIIYTIIGVLIAVSFTVVLRFIEPFFFSGYLRYGYFAKLLTWIWLLVVFLYAAQIEKQKFLLWSDKKQSLTFYTVSVLAVMILVFVSGSFQHFLPQLGIKEQTSPLLVEMLAYFHTHFILLILTCITAGIVEELLFRGYLLPRLTILFNNKYMAVIISALLFGLSHYGFGTLSNMIGPFLIGLIFSAYYQKYRNIKVLMICHFLIDLIGLTQAVNHSA